MKNRVKLILVRHGQSIWNAKNRFTGWVDVPLSPKGVEEAIVFGRAIRHLPIDVIFVSTLARSMMTALLAMNEHSPERVVRIIHENEGQLDHWGRIYDEGALAESTPLYTSWHLNERCYGELQGMNKDDMRVKYGKEQVHIWRRSFSVPPPNGESLEMTAERTIPYFDETIVAALDGGNNVLVSAHGNSLRSIIMKLDGLSEDEVVNLEIGTGVPIIYDYEKGQFKKSALDTSS